MSVKTKDQLKTQNNTDITTNGSNEITGEKHNTINEDMIDSWFDYPISYTTDQRNALSAPAAKLVIYNSTNARYEFYDGTTWWGIGFTRHENPLYIKAAGNSNLTTDQNNDWRIIESGGNLVYQKYVAGVWTEMAAIGG